MNSTIRPVLAVSLAVFAMACGSVASDADGGGDDDDGSVTPTIDASGGSVDSAPGDIDAASDCGWSFPVSNVTPCDGPRPTGSLSLLSGAHFLDTSAMTLDGEALDGAYPAAGGDGEVLVVITKALVVGNTATLNLRGNRPLIILVEGDDTLPGIASIQGTIDLSAYELGGNWHGGAGAESGCGGIGRGGSPSVADQNGGGGGGFGAPGGLGGFGAIGSGTVGARGAQDLDGDLAPLRGGCGGGPGGDLGSPGGLPGGSGGTAGGALQIAARSELTVTGTIKASGGPGRPGQNGGPGAGGAGSGGGGSGGGILLESLAINIKGTAAVCANGGSGAEGGGASVPGDDGVLGTCDANAGAPGLDGGGLGGKGGDGGFRLVPEGGDGGAGTASSSPGGGGGGGGAVGRIVLHAYGAGLDIDLTATVTPTPTMD